MPSCHANGCQLYGMHLISWFCTTHLQQCVAGLDVPVCDAPGMKVVQCSNVLLEEPPEDG